MSAKGQKIGSAMKVAPTVVNVHGLDHEDDRDQHGEVLDIARPPRRGRVNARQMTRSVTAVQSRPVTGIARHLHQRFEQEDRGAAMMTVRQCPSRRRATATGS